MPKMPAFSSLLLISLVLSNLWLFPCKILAKGLGTSTASGWFQTVPKSSCTEYSLGTLLLSTNTHRFLSLRTTCSPFFIPSILERTSSEGSSLYTRLVRFRMILYCFNSVFPGYSRISDRNSTSSLTSSASFRVFF